MNHPAEWARESKPWEWSILKSAIENAVMGAFSDGYSVRQGDGASIKDAQEKTQHLTLRVYEALVKQREERLKNPNVLPQSCEVGEQISIIIENPILKLQEQLSEKDARIKELEAEKPFPLDAYYAVERDNAILRSLADELAGALEGHQDCADDFGGWSDEAIAVLAKYTSWKGGKK
jgi:hypothetical protein